MGAKSAFSCKGCDKRYPGCHGQCDTYIQEKAAHEAKREAERKRRYIEDGLDCQEARVFARYRKGKPFQRHAITGGQ